MIATTVARCFGANKKATVADFVPYFAAAVETTRKGAKPSGQEMRDRFGAFGSKRGKR